jgi:HSP20 family protein
MAKEKTTSSDLKLRAKQELQQEGTRPGLVFRPEVDILERADTYLIYADLPGVDEKHVQIRLENGVLSLDAELATAPDPAWGDPIHAEYRLGSFHREFRLSDEIDPAGVNASMRGGVLELRLPKTERHQPRQITVRGG